MAAGYVFPGTAGHPMFAAMATGKLAVGPGPYVVPDEYQPIALSVEEDLDDLFLEPSISATYFAFVDLPVGGEWVVTDVQGQVLYPCRVSTKTPNKRSGTVSYTFKTYMSMLSSYEPPGVLISSEDAGLGRAATPTEAFTYLFNKWRLDHPGLSLTPIPAPGLVLRGSSGNVEPFVFFLSVLQPGGNQNRSMLEIMAELFAAFSGYRYRLSVMRLEVIPPPYQQTTSVPLLETDIISRSESSDLSTVVNSQTVSSRPYVLDGVYPATGPNGPVGPIDLPEVAGPVYYRQGKTLHVAKPDNRAELPNGYYVPLTYSEDLFPVGDSLYVTWTAYIFASVRESDGSTRTRDVSEGVVQKTHVVGLGPGRYFDAVTRWFYGSALTQDAVEGVWVWRIHHDGPKGIRAVLITPTNEETYVRRMRFDGIFSAYQDWSLGAEFHLNIQGTAYKRSDTSYSATYGVYSPPTLPASFDAPPYHHESEPAVDASFATFGKQAGDDLDLGVFSLASLDAIADIGRAVRGEPSGEQIITDTLIAIAQNAVKTQLLPYKKVTLELAPPYKVTAPYLGRLVTMGTETGPVTAYRYREAHSLSGRQLEAQIEVRVDQTTEMQPITFVPPPAPAQTPYLPPGYPPTGDFPGPAPFEPTPITAGPGDVQLDFGRRWDGLAVERVGAGARRIRLYRTAQARTDDAARTETEVYTSGASSWTVNTKPAPGVADLLIGEFRIAAGDPERLDLHAILGHTPEGVTYANISGGQVRFHRFTPEGREE